MGLDRRSESQLTQAHQDRRLPLELVDAGGQALAEALGEEVRAIAGNEPLVGRPQRVGKSDEPRAEVLQSAPVDTTPTVRRGDEDHSADLRAGLEDQGAAEEVAIVRIAREFVKGPIADEPPQAGPAVLDHHLGQQAAHAVADEDHPFERLIRAGAVELPSDLIQVATQQRGRVGERVARRVAERPELIALTEGRIGLQARDHPAPRPRVRPKPVDENHRDFAALVGSDERQAGRLIPEHGRDIGIRLRRGGGWCRARCFDRRRGLCPGECRRDEREDKGRGSDGTHTIDLHQRPAGGG